LASVTVDDDDDKILGLETGAFIGVVCGLVVLIVVIVVVIRFCRRGKSNDGKVRPK